MIKKRRLTIREAMIFVAVLALDLACLANREGDYRPLNYIGLLGVLVIPWAAIMLYASHRHEPWLLALWGLICTGALIRAALALVRT